MMSFVFLAPSTESVGQIIWKNYVFHKSSSSGSDQRSGCPFVVFPAVVSSRCLGREIRKEQFCNCTFLNL